MTRLRALSIGDFLPTFHAFRDRADAGAQLAARLEAYRGRDILVLGTPVAACPSRPRSPDGWERS